MRHDTRKLKLPTRGERNLALAYLLVAGLGSLIAFFSVVRLMNQGPFVELGFFEWWVCIAGALGAVLALHASERHLGNKGAEGALRAIWGAFYLSLVGSLVAGTLVLPVFGTMFGPFTLAITLIGAPILAAAWLSAVLLAHLTLLAYREEMQHEARLMRLHSAQS